MPIQALIDDYAALRREPVWMLLAADTAPETMALLQTLFFNQSDELRESVLLSRLGALLNKISYDTITPEQVRLRVDQWRAGGLVERRLTHDSNEPTYSLSAGAFKAIQFIISQRSADAAPSENRLELLLHSINRLVVDTDKDPKQLIASLESEIARLKARIKNIRAGRFEVIDDFQIRARIRDIIGMIDSLDGDFLRVRQSFQDLASQIYTDIMQTAHTRGEGLGRIFDRIDNIQESDAGRSFDGFYSLLIKELNRNEVRGLIDVLEQRDFWDKLDVRQQDAVSEVFTDLSEKAARTQDQITSITNSLNQFVKTRAYLADRELSQVLEETRRLAVKLCTEGGVRSTEKIYELTLSRGVVAGIGAARPYDPQTFATQGDVETAESSDITDAELDALSHSISQSEIDYRYLRWTIMERLKELETVSIGDVLDKFPARQGLASIIGYISLARRYAVEVSDDRKEYLNWEDRCGNALRGRVPVFLFSRGCFGEAGR